MRSFYHYLGLTIAIALGAILRFTQLDAKPLWLDEVITALLSLGRSYDVPLDTLFPLSELADLFTFNPATTCPDIAQAVTVQSTHPPLFFCLMHWWLMHNVGEMSITWQLRALPALIGTGAIAAVYYLGRIAFSPTAGLMSAAVMAVSPFGIYLSQSARHYTLPVLLMTGALISLIQISQSLRRKTAIPVLPCLSWVLINSIGLRVHYFFLLGFIAQVVTLVALIVQLYPRTISLSKTILPLGCCVLPIVSFLPWIPTFIEHFSRPETSWLPQPHNIAPLYQIFAGWVLMTIILPVEDQPWWIAVPSGIAMLVFTGWLCKTAIAGMRQLKFTLPVRRFSLSSKSLGAWILVCFTGCVLLQFLVIIYILKKDISLVPRYHFVYFASICTLLGASLWKTPKSVEALRHNRWLTHPLSIVVCVGIISGLCVVSDLAFQQPFQPRAVAQRLSSDTSIPQVSVVQVQNLQDIALGLSFALETQKVDPTAEGYMVIVERSPDFHIVWDKLAELSSFPPPPLNLWIFAPGMRRQEYLSDFRLKNQALCTLDPNELHQIGIPYGRYYCQRIVDN